MAQNVITSGGNFPRSIPALIQFGVERRRSVFQAAHGVFFAPLPGDALFDVDLTLQNVVSGSAWRVEDTADDSLVDSGSAVGGDITVTVPYYGSSRTLRIKVRKGTSTPFYQAFETLATVGSSGGSVYVSQIPDE